MGTPEAVVDSAAASLAAAVVSATAADSAVTPVTAVAADTDKPYTAENSARTGSSI